MIQYFPIVTGSLTVNGDLIVTGTGSMSASLALNSNLLQGTGSTGFATTASLLAVSSSQQQISASLLTLTASYTALSSSYTALSGSYNTFSGSESTRITKIENNYATTGSNSFRADQSITGSLVVSSTITAQTLVVQTVTSSIVYSSGSNLFGSALSNTQTFTGSIQASGSSSHFLMGGSVGIGTTNPQLKFVVSNAGAQGFEINSNSGAYAGGVDIICYNRSTIAYAPMGFDASQITFSTNASGERMRITSAGNIGIGSTNPTQKVEIQAPANLWATRFIGANVASQSYGFYVDAGTNATDTNAMFRSNGGSSVYFYIGGDGKVGVGTSTPSFQLDVYPGVANTTIRAGSYAIMQSVTTNQAMFGLNVAYATSIGTGWRYINTDYATAIRMHSGDIIFHLAASGTAGTQPANWDTTDAKMTIKNGGNVIIGSTNDQVSWKAQVTGNLFVRGNNSTSANSALYIDNSSGTTLLLVRNDGYLTTGTASASPYNYGTGTSANCVIDTDGALRRSTSSLKYKNDVRNYDKGLAEVLQMRPVFYKGKNDGETQFAGLIAEEIHELGLTEFVQYAEDGRPDALAYQNMIALLTKAIQELSTKLDQANTKIAALEAK